MKFNDLSIQEKAAVIKLGVGSGLRSLQEIRQFWDGMPEDPPGYYEQMEKVANENYRKWGYDNPDEALVHALNDNTYDYRGFYRDNPNAGNNAETHWPDTYKTVYHPTFSNESRYSGIIDRNFNPEGKVGGRWSGDNFIPAKWQNKYPGGGDINILRVNKEGLLEHILPEVQIYGFRPGFLERIQGRVSRFANSAYNNLKEAARNIYDTQAMIARRYSSKDGYTFQSAYKDARQHGDKTFYFDGRYYSTDYQGSHGRQYIQDLLSGKADEFERLYPGFTNPELRREKEEELATYGITNEQTRNKGFITNELLSRIPARGYNVSDAISAIKDEYYTYRDYDNPDLMLFDIHNKFDNKFNDFPVKVINDRYTNNLVFQLPEYDVIQKYQNKLNNEDREMFNKYISELRERQQTLQPQDVDPYSSHWHDNEYSYFLGIPTKPSNSSPIISRYRTGNEPYYYTYPDLEQSTPFVRNQNNQISQPFNLQEYNPGNYLAASGNPESYYIYNPNKKGVAGQQLNNSRYDDIIFNTLDLFNITPRVGDLSLFAREWNDPAYKNGVIQTRTYPMNVGRLGTYTLGIPQNKQYISIYDKFDIDPFGAGDDTPLIQLGKPFEYYTRFYEDGEPNIDSLYNTLQYSKGGSIHIKPENRGKFTALKKRTGHSATWFKKHGTPAQRKMATFELNSRHWNKHALGGYLEGGIYDLPEEEIMKLINAGYEIEYL